MALIDYYPTGGGHAPPELSGTAFSVVADGDFGGGYAIEPTGAITNNTMAIGTTASPTTPMIFGFRYGQGAVGASNDADQFAFTEIGSNATLRFRFQSDGTIDVYLDNSGDIAGFPAVFVATITGVDMTAVNYYAVEWYPHNSTGVLRIRVNGAIPAGWTDFPSGDTHGGSGTSTGVYTFHMGDEAGGLSVPRFGDFVAWDSSGAGLTDVARGPFTIPFFPINSSGESGWTGDDADQVDNHLRVNAVPLGGPGHIESGTATDRQVFGTDDSSLPATGSIIAVKTRITGLEPAAGSQDVGLGVRENSTDSALTTVTLGAVESVFDEDPVLTQPDGGGDWDAAALAGIETLLVVQ